MKTQQLQALLRQNAEAITATHEDIYTARYNAKRLKDEGYTDLVKSVYKHADKLRSKLAKQVAMQRSLKVELQYNQRIERIERLHMEVFGRPVSAPQYTSVEQEQMLLALAWEKHENAMIDAIVEDA